jgi:hypothetical protein
MEIIAHRLYEEFQSGVWRWYLCTKLLGWPKCCDVVERLCVVSGFEDRQYAEVGVGSMLRRREYSEQGDYFSVKVHLVGCLSEMLILIAVRNFRNRCACGWKLLERDVTMNL